MSLFKTKPAQAVSSFEERITKSFARCFRTTDGKEVLAFLQKITKHRVLGSDATDAQLRTLEGQRALVLTIERMIERGVNGQ